MHLNRRTLLASLAAMPVLQFIFGSSLGKAAEQPEVKGAVLLSGNVHYTEVSKTDEASYPLYDFTSSGMTHNSTTYAEFINPYRVAGPYTKNNFGLVEIDWLAKPAVTIALKTISLDGAVVSEHQVSLSELK
jgi:alkaline phosphatase D